MLEKTTVVPNQPGMTVLVRYYRATHSPFGKEVKIPGRFVGVSAVSVSAGKSTKDQPVTWRFVQGYGSQDDPGTPGSEWHEWSLQIPRSKADARETLEEEGQWGLGEDFEWYVLAAKQQ
jgi:hypothetical protein